MASSLTRGWTSPFAPALAGRFLTPGSPSKSPWWRFFFWMREEKHWNMVFHVVFNHFWTYDLILLDFRPQYPAFLKSSLGVKAGSESTENKKLQDLCANVPEGSGLAAENRATWRWRWNECTPVFLGLPGGSAGKESTCNVGNLGSVPGLGRSPGEQNSYPLQYSCTSLVAQLVKNPPAMQETVVRFLGWEDPLEKG